MQNKCEMIYNSIVYNIIELCDIVSNKFNMKLYGFTEHNMIW